MKPRVYLCGQITGLSYQEATYGWRAQVYDGLRDLATVLSPMRAKKMLEETQELSCMGDPGHVLNTPRGITARDRMDTQRSTLIFCNLVGMDRVSVGSMIEFGWADAWRVPILCCMEPGNPHEHAMPLDIISWRCESLDEGIEVARAVLSEGL